MIKYVILDIALVLCLLFPFICKISDKLTDKAFEDLEKSREEMSEILKELSRME